MVCTENMFREHVPAGTVPRTSMNARHDSQNIFLYIFINENLVSCVDTCLYFDLPY